MNLRSVGIFGDAGKAHVGSCWGEIGWIMVEFLRWFRDEFICFGLVF